MKSWCLGELLGQVAAVRMAAWYSCWYMVSPSPVVSVVNRYAREGFPWRART
jgi:hypothetical protein